MNAEEDGEGQAGEGSMTQVQGEGQAEEDSGVGPSHKEAQNNLKLQKGKMGRKTRGQEVEEGVMLFRERDCCGDNGHGDCNGYHFASSSICWGAV